MSYGTIKVDTITFTDNSVDKSVSLSGLIQNPTFTGNITVTGTISGDVIRGGTTVSGATVTGTTANFVSGVFTTQISGATVTGTTASFTSGVFTNISGTTAIITSGIIASGTAAAPSLAILADLDTGLFSPGADQVAVATNGTGRLFVDATGNVGVGLTPASYAGYSVIGHGSTTGATLEQRVNGILVGSLTTDSQVTLKASTAIPIVFSTNNTERLRITSAGLVGIGTSSPGHILDVAGSTTTPIARIQSSSTGNNVLLSCQNLNGFAAGGGSRIRFGTLTQGVSAVEAGFDYDTASFQVTKNGSTLFTATSTGLGIGTTAPNRKLEVSDAGADNFIRVNTTGATKSGIEFASSGTAYSQLYFTNVSPYDLSLLQQYTTGSLILGTNSTEKARLTSSGQLLVGTSTSRAVTAGTSGNWEPRLQVTKTGIDAANIAAYSFSTYAVDLGGGLGIGPDIVLARSNSDTEGTQTAIANNMLLGRITFNGSDGTAFQSGAFIAAASDGQTWASGDCPTRLVFSTTADGGSSPTERMRITSTGQVRLAGAGITFNGDTAAANELDDYEEGTWTPTLGGTATYSFQSATYTKVGRQVTVNCYLDVSAIGTGSTSIISGLPFTVGTFAPASGAVSRLTASAVNVTSLQVQLSGTTVTTVGMTVAGNMATQNVFGTGTAIFFTAVYFV
jgi:hypothetical protein